MSLSFGKKEPKDMLAKARRDLRRMEDAELAKDSDAMSDALMDVSVSLASVRDWLRALAKIKGRGLGELEMFTIADLYE